MIFLIDDDEIQNTINVRIIEIVAPGKVVRVFNNAREALDELTKIKSTKASEEPDFLLLDLNMPQMNGWEFLTQFEEAEYPWPVYILTSSINEQDRSRSRNFPLVKGFISKPLTTSAFASILNEYKE